MPRKKTKTLKKPSRLVDSGIGNFTGAERPSWISVPKRKLIPDPAADTRVQARDVVVKVPTCRIEFPRARLDAILMVAGKAVYEAFLREAGFAKDARCPSWDKLKTFQQRRWQTVAQNALDAAGMKEILP
jgi:hypothetical protein